MSYDVAVVGLGYVGLTLATALADTGFRVLGVERRPEVVALAREGVPHFTEDGLPEMLGHAVATGRLVPATRFEASDCAQIYIITVGTPLGPDGAARLDFIEVASREVAEAMPDGALVILRSTVKIGTARHVVTPILAATGRRFGLAMCPERTLEGRAMRELRTLPQIVGADTPETRERAANFFYKLTPTVVQVSSLEAAEIMKLVDNTYRDVQFGFANEVARICDSFGVNVLEVVQGGKLGYERTNVALPGLVGGPCLGKDPHILAQSLAPFGVELAITTAARRVNEQQPAETVAWMLAEHFRRGGGPPRVALLGIAFKGVPATDDLRGSMALRVLEALRTQAPDVTVTVFDPVCTPRQLADAVPGVRVAETIEAALADAEIAILANNHAKFASLRPRRLLGMMAPGGFVYDYWNHFSALRPHELDPSYFAVGNTRGGRS